MACDVSLRMWRTSTPRRVTPRCADPIDSPSAKETENGHSKSNCSCAARDNFGVLIHDPESGETALDRRAGGSGRSWRRSKRRGWTLTDILTTHHHADHVEANLALKTALRAEDHRPGRRGRDKFPASTRRWRWRRCSNLPATSRRSSKRRGIRPAISASISRRQAAFSGRHAVCARLRPPVRSDAGGDVELAAETGGAAGRYHRLFRPRIHAVQCAFRRHGRSDNAALKDRAAEDRCAACRGQAYRCRRRSAWNWPPTPSCGRHDPAIRRTSGMENASDAEVFAEIRKRKDNF